MIKNEQDLEDCPQDFVFTWISHLLQGVGTRPPNGFDWVMERNHPRENPGECEINTLGLLSGPFLAHYF